MVQIVVNCLIPSFSQLLRKYDESNKDEHKRKVGKEDKPFTQQSEATINNRQHRLNSKHLQKWEMGNYYVKPLE